MNNQFETWWNEQPSSKVQPAIMAQALKELAFSAWNAAIKVNDDSKTEFDTMSLIELAEIVGKDSNSVEYFDNHTVILCGTRHEIIAYSRMTMRFVVRKNELDVREVIKLSENTRLMVEVWKK